MASMQFHPNGLILRSGNLKRISPIRDDLLNTGNLPVDILQGASGIRRFTVFHTKYLKVLEKGNTGPKKLLAESELEKDILQKAASGNY